MSSGCPFHHSVEDAVLPEAFLLLLVDVGGVLEDGVLRSIEHFVLMDAVMILGSGGEDLLDELPFGVRGHVAFVAVVAAVVLFGEGSFGISRTRAIVPLPSLRDFADRGIDALAAGDDDAVFPELPFHFGEECFVPFFLHEDLPKPADRRFVRNVRVGGDT